MVLRCLHPVCLQILAVLTVLVTISYGKVFDNIACNGVNRTCAKHNLWCRDKGGLVIKKAQYGYVVPQVQCGSVTTNCTNWGTCCRYDKSDCLVDFTASDMSKIYECSGLSYCKILPPPRGVAGNCSDNKDYVYSRIQHGCSNASVIINLSDKTKQEINKNQVIIKYDKYKKSKYIGEGDEDDSDEDEDDDGNRGRHESSEMKKKDKKKEDKIDEGEIDLGCHCQVSFITYVFLYQTNDEGRPLNVGNYIAESDTWYKIDDGLGFEIILPKHNVNIILRAKNEHRKIQSVTCGCYNDDAGVAVDDTKHQYLKRANLTEVENFFIPKDDNGSGKETGDNGVGEEKEDGGNDDKDPNVVTTSHQDNSPKKSDKMGLIIGIALGSLCLIVVIIISIILARKWKNKKDNAGKKTSTPVSDPSSVHDQHYYDSIKTNQVGVISDVETGRRADNSNHIGDINTANKVDTYNHIGDIKPSSQGDTYNHIGDIKPSCQGDTYNHIGDIKPSCQGDTYNHIGDIKTGNQGDTYNHIGDIKTGNQGDTYNHIGDIKTDGQADTYNHIGDIKTGNQTDTYNHIGDIKPSNPADTSNYDHIGGNKTSIL